MTSSALAVSAIRGVNLVWVSPETSAPNRRAAPNPMVGATATKRTTIPIPPSHWVMLRQKRMDGVWASTSESSDAPVVVKPLIASKVESRRLPKVPSTKNGTPPSSAASTQASVTERYTSLLETYSMARLEGGLVATIPAPPAEAMTTAGNRKLAQEPSL